MKYTTVIMLLVGAISTSQAIHLESNQSIYQEKQSSAMVGKKVIKLQQRDPVTGKTIEPKQNLSQQKIEIQIQNQQKTSSKAEELEAMEMALKQATEETHKQRLQAEINSEPNKFITIEQKAKERAEKALKAKHEKEEAELKKKLDAEEDVRQKEIKQNEQYEGQIKQAEVERKNQEVVVAQRAKELRSLQEEEASEKLEAERREQDFLAAQAVQETKAAAAKKAAAHANLARLKRKHELQRRNAEARMEMLKIKQESEAQQTMSQIQQLSQSTKKIEQTQKIAAEIDQKEKSQAEAKAKAEAEKKEATEKAAQLEKEKKEAERASAEKKQREQAEAEAQKKQAAEEEREKKEAKHQQLVQAKKQQREAAHVKQEDKLQKELEQFSVTLNDKHYTNAVQIMDQIKESGYPEPKFTVNTSEIFKGQFTFPQIAHNDFAVEQLEELSIHEENLKKDPENEKMKEEFVQSAEDIAGKLKERYGEQWVNPRDQE